MVETRKEGRTYWRTGTKGNTPKYVLVEVAKDLKHHADLLNSKQTQMWQFRTYYLGDKLFCFVFFLTGLYNCTQGSEDDNYFHFDETANYAAAMVC